jgi:YHS domain-containing protein
MKKDYELFHQTERSADMVKDLVCKMTIDEKTAPYRSEYQGKTYYFCAKGCLVAFERDPEKYIPREQD